MGCFGSASSKADHEESKKGKETNKKINQQLQKDKQIYRATHRLLLLGNHLCSSQFFITFPKTFLLSAILSFIFIITSQNFVARGKYVAKSMLFPFLVCIPSFMWPRRLVFLEHSDVELPPS